MGRLSILVLTLDEERNLERCLASARFADQLVVVDSGSTDGTERIARDLGSEFVRHPFEGYARQRNWALETLAWTGDWIFVLDADEAFTDSLREEIHALVAGNPPEDGFYVGRRVYFQGRFLRHCGWYPNWNLRLFRRGRARYDDRPVHEHLALEGRAGYLHAELIHEDRKGMGAFHAKHRRYAALEAEARLASRRRGLWASRDELLEPATRRRTIKRELWPFVPLKPLAFFLHAYLWKRGFLDGRQGLVFCILMARHERSVTRHLRALSRAKGHRSWYSSLRP